MSDALRIMHVVCSDRFAGVEQFVLRLAVAQAEAGHDVHVIGGAEPRMREPLATANATWAAATGVRQAFSALRSRSNDVDVVNAHMTDADAAAVLALGRRGPALVSTRHFALPRGRALGVPVDLLVRRRVDAEIAISTAVAGATGIPSTVVHSGVPEAAPDTGAPRERVVLMAQRLQPEKRTDVGIRAFVSSGLARDGWRLDIAGAGPLHGDLQRLIDELDAGESVRLLGFRDDVPELLRTAGLFLAPCEVEGLGLAVLEAMSAGIAPIAAAAAGHRDVLAGLDERSGYRPGDIEDAATALRTLAGDDERRARLAAAARDRARTEFSLEGQVACTDAVYRRALERTGGRRA
ncbi:glycosyltransferase involved in cell wall biosynthesis [Microbacterium sp. W4I4]|uniref:glycosyltransferase n=1 Tax=Microbacterium sp. W4I4 TaxID=3042295 RepID=UPI0027824C7F|nr:glycosyltransferase [Microbacterium sp. W4I4]MDQ0613762.1 glycosyltransferase involved in cell wall biosynthesis [Microbacterium sp. W4I4]